MYNTRIENGLMLSGVKAGLSGAPTAESTYGSISPVQYQRDDSAVNQRAAASLISEIDKVTDSTYVNGFYLPEVFRALSIPHRAIFYTQGFRYALLGEALRDGHPYEYARTAMIQIEDSGIKVDTDHKSAHVWIITDKVINIPDVEQYSSYDATRDKTRVPLNFEITDPSKIQLFLSAEPDTHKTDGFDWM